MIPGLLILIIYNQLDIFGYVETRPYVVWGDSVHVTGYHRGWLEFRTAQERYGIQTAFDCILPYDTLAMTAPGTGGLNISRLALWLGPEDLRITAGRQRIIWGAARVFRPLDFFNPANLLEPGYERKGIDAVLGEWSMARLSSLRAFCLPQSDPRRIFFGGRLGTNILGNDLGLNAFYRDRDMLAVLGGDAAGEYFLGYWGEMTYAREDTIDHLELSGGADYTFPYMIYAMAEYFYDQSGEGDPALYDYGALANGLRSTLGRQYLYASIGLVRNMFFQPTVSAVVNLGDRGFILIPNINYNVLENFDVSAGLNLFFGPDDSEFKNLAGINGAVYFWAKAYF